MTRLARGALFALIGLMIGLSHSPAAEAQAEQQALVDKAKATVATFAADPDMDWLRENMQKARGVMVVPSMVKGGFVLGGSGGAGVLLARGKEGNNWSYPAFYTLGSVTFGLQIGGEVSEVLLMIMTQKGMDAMLSTEAKLGADTSVAVGPVGAGAKAQTADVIAFSRTKGLYGGISVEGAVAEPRDEWNAAYYEAGVRPVEILEIRKVKNAGADPLRKEVAGIAKR